MKELSIKEKAKRYDEALKVLHKYDGANIMFSQSLKEEMFPELKESEGERIRKRIIHALHGDVLEMSEIKEAVDWLEKQGEHANFLNKIQVGDKVTRNQDGMLVNLSQLNRVAKKDEKQGKNNMGISEATKQKLEDNLNEALEKETPESWNEFLDEGKQKSRDNIVPKFKVGDTIYYNSFGEVKSMLVADVVTDSTDNPMYEDKEGNAVFEKDIIEQKPAWSEEDERIRQETIDWFEKKCFPYALESENPAKESIKWLKSLKDRVLPQPMQEWSEEDEDILNTIINHFKVDIGCTDEDDMVRWLKFLKDRVQPKQEWSEEDNEQCDRAIYMMEQLEMTESWDDVYNWLKSIKDKYTWKPSDNELEVLRLAAEKDGACLMGLYEQLKKLREE
jgi:hypothetical protein